MNDSAKTLIEKHTHEQEEALYDDEEGSVLDAEDAKKEATKLQFDPIDARFLSSAPLVRARLVKLLKHSQNQMHAYKNIMIAIVRPFSNHVHGTKTERSLL